MEISVHPRIRATENRDSSAPHLKNLKCVLRSMLGYMYGNGQPFRPILHIFR